MQTRPPVLNGGPPPFPHACQQPPQPPRQTSAPRSIHPVGGVGGDTMLMWPCFVPNDCICASTAGSSFCYNAGRPCSWVPSITLVQAAPSLTALHSPWPLTLSALPLCWCCHRHRCHGGHTGQQPAPSDKHTYYKHSSSADGWDADLGPSSDSAVPHSATAHLEELALAKPADVQC
jgi:hypothetical protein